MPSDRSLRRLLIQWSLLWSAIILTSLLWNEHLSRERITDFAHKEAETTIQLDLNFRRWIASHGGVYVPPTGHTPPNPWLDVPKRDVVTTNGDKLTLMNPAYAIRQLITLRNATRGTRGHITSLHLKNPDNAPDEWEHYALLQFEKGVKSVSAITEYDGAPYYRLITPMLMEKECLKCHADTNIPVGGIRGGISAAAPLLPLQLAADKTVKSLRFVHGSIWLLGMVSLSIGTVLYDRQQRRREEAEERLRETTMFLRESQTIARVAGWKSCPVTNLLRWTDEMYSLLECPEDFVLAYETGLSFFHPDDRLEIVEAIDEAWKSGAGFSHTCRMITAKNNELWAELRCIGRVENGSGSYLVGTLQDITQYKQTEQMLINARDAAEASIKVKSEFLAIISHELRTPLNGVVGGAQLLGMTRLSDEQQEYLKMIELSATNELALVNDLLDLASMDAVEIKILDTPFMLEESLNAGLLPYHSIIEEAGLLFTVELADNLQTTVIGDNRRLTQIVGNLLGNAVKFTKKGEIIFTADAKEDVHDTVMLEFTVCDTGIGISEEDQQRIFEPFVQADMSHTRSYGGTGLGLSICNKLIKRMHGNITVKSRLGEGSCFNVTIPFKKYSSDMEAVPMTLSTTATEAVVDGNNTVLIAEDNQVNLMATGRLLEKHGYKTVSAVNGQEAVDRWIKGSVDLILMDIQMPVMDGIEALKFIRKHEKRTGGHTKVIALTAHALDTDRNRLFEEGFDGYISKPADMKTLLAEVKRFLG